MQNTPMKQIEPRPRQKESIQALCEVIRKALKKIGTQINIRDERGAAFVAATDGKDKGIMAFANVGTKKDAYKLLVFHVRSFCSQYGEHPMRVIFALEKWFIKEKPP